MRATIDNMQKLKSAASRACLKQIEASERDLEEFQKFGKAEKSSDAQGSFRASMAKSDSLERENLQLKTRARELESELGVLRGKTGRAVSAIRAAKPAKKAARFQAGSQPNPFRHSVQ
jgi:hypothetical protein